MKEFIYIRKTHRKYIKKIKCAAMSFNSGIVWKEKLFFEGRLKYE